VAQGIAAQAYLHRSFLCGEALQCLLQQALFAVDLQRQIV
jgi:hypothetical protein